ncbi:PHD finger protein 14 isoform X1 [Tachysurus ichikawai]
MKRIDGIKLEFVTGCYGVDGESDSIMSSASENSTEPWFCDACKNGVMPSCELCPSQDGIFKETDAGRCGFQNSLSNTYLY